MTAEAFLQKYPKTKPNRNSLEDIACPDCGSRGGFEMEVKTTMFVSDEGTDTCSADVEWEGYSWTKCDRCGKASVLDYFTVEGLDQLIEERKRK